MDARGIFYVSLFGRMQNTRCSSQSVSSFVPADRNHRLWSCYGRIYFIWKSLFSDENWCAYLDSRFFSLCRLEINMIIYAVQSTSNEFYLLQNQTLATSRSIPNASAKDAISPLVGLLFSWKAASKVARIRASSEVLGRLLFWEKIEWW